VVELEYGKITVPTEPSDAPTYALFGETAIEHTGVAVAAELRIWQLVPVGSGKELPPVPVITPVLLFRAYSVSCSWPFEAFCPSVNRKYPSGEIAIASISVFCSSCEPEASAPVELVMGYTNKPAEDCPATYKKLSFGETSIATGTSFNPNGEPVTVVSEFVPIWYALMY